MPSMTETGTTIGDGVPGRARDPTTHTARLAACLVLRARTTLGPHANKGST